MVLLVKTGQKKAYNGWFKGIVHLKLNILSLIAHPHVIPNPELVEKKS